MGITFPLPVWPAALALNPASKASTGLYGGRCNILRKKLLQDTWPPGNSKKVRGTAMTGLLLKDLN